MYDGPNSRNAYLAGAMAAFQSVVIHVPPQQQQRLQAWFEQLWEWERGEPPKPPHPLNGTMPAGAPTASDLQPHVDMLHLADQDA